MHRLPRQSVIRYVAFLRAVNVGGHIVKMNELRALFESIPLSSVSTFIASGNVIFDSKKPPSALETSIEKKLKVALGYDVVTMVRSTEQIAAVAEHASANRLDEAGGTLYVGFLKRTPSAAGAKAAEALSNSIDTLSVFGNEFYWQARKSFAESTLAGTSIERLLGPATIRNINTVRRLVARTAPRAHP
jgi:uncharacterized protein (DUF1697 family)